jgi:hypothetical protein
MGRRPDIRREPTLICDTEVVKRCHWFVVLGELTDWKSQHTSPNMLAGPDVRPPSGQHGPQSCANGGRRGGKSVLRGKPVGGIWVDMSACVQPRDSLRLKASFSPLGISFTDVDAVYNSAG